MTRNAFARMGSALFVLLCIAVATATPAAAEGTYGHGIYGTDISWPQCGRGFDTMPTNDFTIVGVNGGEPFTMNPCFASEYSYMRSQFPDVLGQTAGVYVNLQYGEAQNGYSDCAAGDHACAAHDYGYLAAQYAYTQANFLTHGDTLQHVRTWWLDVETANEWSGDSNLNAQVVRGALDFLASTGKYVGIYSTPRQWRWITGGYNPGPKIGNWVAGADGTDDAALCTTPLWPGGQVWIFQYLNLDIDLDQNRGC